MIGENIGMIKWLNTPLDDVIKSAENIYGDLECSIVIGQGLMQEETAYGMTSFNDDGTVSVVLDAEQTYSTMMETLAHELAHVIRGKENATHDEHWQSVFDNIFNEYNRYGKEKYENK